MPTEEWAIFSLDNEIRNPPITDSDTEDRTAPITINLGDWYNATSIHLAWIK